VPHPDTPNSINRTPDIRRKARRGMEPHLLWRGPYRIMAERQAVRLRSSPAFVLETRLCRAEFTIP